MTECWFSAVLYLSSFLTSYAVVKPESMAVDRVLVSEPIERKSNIFEIRMEILIPADCPILILLSWWNGTQATSIQSFVQHVWPAVGFHLPANNDRHLFPVYMRSIDLVSLSK